MKNKNKEVQHFHPETLGANSAQLSTFVEIMPVAIAMFDKNMRYIAYSRRWLSDYNLGDQVLYGKSHYEIFPEIGDDWKAIHQRALNGETSISTNEPFLRSDGKTQWLRWEVMPWYEQDMIGGIIMYTEDITHLFSVSSKASQQNEKYRLAMDAINDGIWDWDVVSGHVDYSSSWSKIIGEELVEPTYNAWESRIHPDDKKPCLESLTNHLNGLSSSWSFEHRLKHANGSWVWVLGRGNIVSKDSNGKPLRMIGTMTDIHDRHLAEQENLKLSIEKAAAEIGDIQKSKFLANMSHEIRTPLNAIIHMNKLAIENEKPTEKNLYLKDSLTAAKNLLVIIDDILDYSKIEAGKLAIESIPFDVYELIQTVLTISNSSAIAKNIVIISDVDDNIPLLQGDPTRLRQVLINLINNAIKYSNSDSKVLINVTQQNIDNDVSLKITVSDSGIGISEEQKSRLFKPFSQADSSTTRKYGGTGLGLSIVKNLVEMMGGEINVESQPGKGATFTIKLKLQKSSPDSINHKALHKASIMTSLEDALNILHDKKIMVVEDNSFNMKVLRDTLVNNGMEVISAENGQECLDLLKNNPVDCILMDCQMPVLDGYEATRAIRELPQYQNLPIISMTASAMNQDIQKSINAGMNDHISKPFDRNEMFVIMSKWIKPDDLAE